MPSGSDLTVSRGKQIPLEIVSITPGARGDRAWADGGGQSPPVVALVYYLTEACNLRCSYCYLKKTPQRSSLSVGLAVVDFLLRESKGERNLCIRFFGGEPLLELELIQAIVTYGRAECRRAGKEISYDMVTNGTLITPDALGTLSSLGVQCIVSIDGGREAMERSRPFYNPRQGFGQFDQSNSLAVRSGVARKARMTISPGQENLIKDIEHVIKLGYHEVQITTSNNDKWSEAEVQHVYEQLEEYYLASARSGRIPPLEVTNRLILEYHRIAIGKHVPRKEGFCSAGKGLLGVSTSGCLYPCHRFVQLGDQFRLGTVFSGIEESQRSPYAGVRTDTLHHEMCASCHAQPLCPGSCMAANQVATGDAFYPESRHCYDLRAHTKVAERLYHTLMDEGCPAFLDYVRTSWDTWRLEMLETLRGQMRD